MSEQHTVTAQRSVWQVFSRLEVEQLRTENARLRAELEAVGAGGVQPLRAGAGWVLVPVEPTLEMARAAVHAIWYSPPGGFDRISGPHRCWSAMLAAAPKAPQQCEPATPQKPELRVGQVWRTRGGGVAEIVDETKKPPHPFWCVCVSGDDQWTVTEAGRYYSKNTNSHDDLIKLISDVPQKPN